MTSEVSKRAREVFQSAQNLSPDSRGAFLDSACGNDASLRHEVESLLVDDASVPFHRVLHYVVLNKLGEGGMGEVYLAEDSKLRRKVALKVLPESLLSDKDRKDRFLQEARAAAAIEHPNIAAVHDILDFEGRTFIVMEYVQGETLTTAIQSGKLDVIRSIDLGIQIGDALSKAHHRGVVHRDLKPDNVLVSEDGYAKIIDFGLAKLFGPASADSLEPLSALDTATAFKTRAGTVLGTAAYMSPEQARGERIDARTDVFSFGAVLYEMLTGEAAFKRPNVMDTVSAVLRDPAPPLKLAYAGRSELDRVLRKALSKKADERYQTIRELVSDLEAFQEQSTRRKLRRPVVAAASVLTLLLALATWWLVGRSPPPTTDVPQEPLSVLIADFDNRTGDPVFDGALEQAVAIGIEEAPFINSYRRGEARAEARAIRPESNVLDEEMGRLVAQRRGINVVVTGAIEGDDGRYRVSIEAIDAQTGESLATSRTSVNRKDQVLSALGDLVIEARRALGDVMPESQQVSGEETFTAGSLEASSAYGQAQELMVVGKWKEAIPLYERAVALDPDFGRAYAGLAACSYNLGHVAEARDYYEAAMARIDRMTERERLRTRGGYYLMVKDYEKAGEEYQALIDSFPFDPAGLSNLPFAYFYERDLQRTLEAAKRVVDVYPENTLSRGNLALFAMYAGEFSTALEEALRVLESNPSYETAFVVEAVSRLAGGGSEKAAETYHRLENVSAFGKSLANTGLADLALYSGRTKDARGILERGIVTDESSGYGDEAARKRLWLAKLELQSGDPGRAVRHAVQALSSSEREHIQYLAAEIFLEAGEPARALALARGLGSRFQPEPRIDASLIEGQFHLKERELQQAIDSFREAQGVLDTWFGRFHLGRAWIEAGAFTEAYSELEACLKRRGEATAVFLDDVPSYHLFPPVYYYLGRAQEGLRSPGAVESYTTFLAIMEDGDATEPLVADARRRLDSLK